MSVGILVDVGQSLTKFTSELVSIDLDVTNEEIHEWTNDVTTNPVEIGAPISDHIQELPDKIRITGMISDSAISDNVIRQFSNIDKIKEKKKKEYQENKQDILSKQKEYRLKNIDSIKQKQKEYYYSMTDEQKEKERTRLREYNRKAYKENPEKFRERARKFHHENKEKRLNYLNKWKEENQDKVIAYRQTSEYKEKGRFFTSRRRAKELTPQWANLEKIKEIYKNCPNGSHVDHIVPLFGKSNNVQIVCGLHCEDNLQYLEALENQSKNCFYWPDMP